MRRGFILARIKQSPDQPRFYHPHPQDLDTTSTVVPISDYRHATFRFKLTTGLAWLPSVEAMHVLGLLEINLTRECSRGFESRKRLVHVWDAFLTASVGLGVLTFTPQGW